MLMTIDRQARTTNPGFVPDSLDPRDQSGALHDALHQPRDLKESLAASDDVVSRRYTPLPGREKESPDSRTFFWESSAISDEAVLLREDMRRLLLEWYLALATAEQGLIDEREQMRLANKLHAAFETEPLEDGMHHEAEEIIEQVLQSGEDPRILNWLKDFSLDDTQPAFAASVLRCLGRQEYLGTSSWRSELVRDALALDDVEIRDAAVQAAESWDDPHILPVLKSHSESESWLRDYISDVIDDLGG
ncbi:MAG: hypothetical protein F4Z28_09845 [Gammaproteobacteria bacterium]|nr:hypothetical protein [Gammaproteobacteria bacterium]